MSKQYHTPLDVWLDLPLRHFTEWIKDSNNLVAEETAEMERRRPKRRSRS